MKKNVVIILIDGGRVDFAQKSEVFKNLKNSSIFFPQSITYAPFTNAAIHALISGSYGNRNGTYSYWHSSNFKNQYFKTLTDYLRELNYYTCFDGHSGLILPQKNFDEYNVHDENNIDLISSHAKLLEKMKIKSDKNKNFFLYLHYSQIHTGIKNEVLIPFNNFSKEYFVNTGKNEQRYSKFFDIAADYLQNILDKIKALNLDKNSIILILSDHGISIGEKLGERAYGSFCYDYTIKTFAYLLIPNVIQKQITQQVRHIDFLPTILDLLEIPLDKSFSEIDGESLLPLINDQPVKEKIAYSETGNPLQSKSPPKSPNVKSIRTSEWKLILNEHDDSKELYHLSEDPSEETNLVDQNPDIEAVLWNEFLKIQKKSEI